MSETKNSRSKPPYGLIIKAAVVLSLIGAAAYLYHIGFFDIFFSKNQVLKFLDSLGPYGFIGFVVLQAMQVVMAPIPGEVAGLIGGYTYGMFWGVVLSTIGLVLGSFIAFSIARTYGRPVAEKFVDKTIMEKFDYLLHHKGAFLIFMLFLLPGFPKDYLCFILGLGHLSTLEFLVISTFGRLFGTILLTLGGGFIRYKQYGKLYVLIGIAIVMVLIALVFKSSIERFLRLLHLKERKRAREVRRALKAAERTSNTAVSKKGVGGPGGSIQYKDVTLPQQPNL
jgi:uncharacterized membrane protein YdjX (TVP38/TMEM64 family)